MSDRYSPLIPISADTLMGKYLRYFWHPVAATAELKDSPKAVEILGEKLVLYRTLSGELGLVQERCPHRNASLACGMIRQNSIQCAYHGWEFNSAGDCLDIPSEGPKSKLASRVHIKSYPIQQLGGLIWAYLGESPAPLLPRYEFLASSQFNHDVGVTLLPCHWLQIAENNMDPYHVEYLHFMYTNYVHEKIGKPKIEVRKHQKVDYTVFEYGISKRRLWVGDSEDSEEWTIGHPQIWPGTAVVTYPNGWVQAQIRVPVNETTTRIYWYNAKQPRENELLTADCPVWDNPYLSPNGSFVPETLNGQDMMVMLTQGTITDRSLETLAESDRGVILYRRVLLEQLDKIARGEEPLGVVRDEAKNTPFIELPMEKHVNYSLAGVSAYKDVVWDEEVSDKAAE